MNIKRIWKNSVSSILVYGVQVLLSLVVSRIVLGTYGSEMNGLISSTGQVFSYIALLEAGIGTASINAFYRPLAEKNKKAINEVYSSSLQYYRRATLWYAVCTVVISFIWPLFIDTQLCYSTIVSIILVQGLSNILTFYFVSSTSAYLAASGQNYINSYFQFAVTFATNIAKIVICFLGYEYIVICFWTLVINAGKCFCYYLYRRIMCSDIQVIKDADRAILKQRNAFLAHEISGVIFSSTDLVLISVFCDLSSASIYAVYSMVVTSITSVIGQVFNSLNYLLGDAFAKKKHFVRVADAYNAIYIPIVFALYTVTYIMLLPFVSIYTQGITDVDYVDPWLPFLFVLVQLLSSCRIIDGAIIKIANHAKKTIGRSIIETTINLVLSLFLVNCIGIYGVLIGTIVALLYRANDIIVYTNKHIFRRSAIQEYKLHGLNFGIFIVFALVNYAINITPTTYFELVAMAIVVCIFTFAVFAMANLLVNRRKIAEIIGNRE